MKSSLSTITFNILFVVLVTGTVVAFVLGDVFIGLIVGLSAIIVFLLFQLFQLEER